MMGMWSFFTLAGLVPEFSANFIAITLHLVAEFLTAILLLRWYWANIETGMEFQCKSYCFRYVTLYGDSKSWLLCRPGGELFLGMFGVLIALTFIFIVSLLLKEGELR